MTKEENSKFYGTLQEIFEAETEREETDIKNVYLLSEGGEKRILIETKDDKQFILGIQ